MSLAPGSRLGPYEIVEWLAAGGMGEVYRGTDSNLKRQVAIKVLPAAMAADEARIARFLREAQVLAALNDPHIAQIYGLERSGDVTAIVMELVEGPTLADRITAGAIPLDEAIPLATQIAEALQVAHEQGIVHRDLKPANIKVRTDGTVKVLDFGLAKSVDPVLSQVDVTHSPTITSPAMTQAGIILGTAAYMSPEQAKGRPADKRSDMWAFGCVLYEMLTGARPFDGEDTADVLGAVVRLEPDWVRLSSYAPPPLLALIRGCLVKERNKRVADASTALFVLRTFESAAKEALRRTGPVSRPKSRLWYLVPATIGVLIGTSFAARSLIRSSTSARQEQPRDVVRLTVTTPPDAPFWAPSFTGLALSRNGRLLVYRSNTAKGSAVTSRLVVRDLANADVTPIAGVQNVANPFLSPDDEWIGYQDFADNALKRIGVHGGTPQFICRLDGGLRGASWGEDGSILFATTVSHGLMRVPATGGEPQRVTTSGASARADHVWPDVLPGGRAALFTVGVGGGDGVHLAVVQLATGQMSDLRLAGTGPRYLSTGHIVYSAGGHLQAVRFDAGALQVRGAPVTLPEPVAVQDVGAAQFALSASGALAHVTGEVTQQVARRSLVWVDRVGRELALDAPVRSYTYARLSPDGTRVALDSRDEQFDIWVWNVERRTMYRLTTNPGVDQIPVWTPDSARIAYSSDREGVRQIFWQRADGSDQPQRLTQGDVERGPVLFTRDGSRLWFITPVTAQPFDLGIVNVDGRTPPELVLHAPAEENNPTRSPDGKWIAYESTSSGRSEIYVRPFPNLDESLQPVSTQGGTRPLWSNDGKELFYYRAPGTIMSVPVTYGQGLVTFGAEHPVVKGTFAEPINAGRHYDVTPDGQRFLMMKDAATAGAPAIEWPRINVVLNFADELKRLAP
ncbi:MAG: protein kinase [Vicinamibacterales bacterium]